MVTALHRVPRGLIWLASALACLVVAGPALAAQLTLTWNDNATNESGTRIERRLNPSGTFSEVATVGPNITSYTDTSVAADQGYCYRVRAYNSAGDSGYSNEACGTAVVPAPPSYTLTVAKNGTGTVTSTSPSNVINCGGDCIELLLGGTQVTLSAAAGTGFTFTGWSGGGCSGSATTCTVTLSANTTVTATFAPPSFILTVAKSGPGTVTSTSPSNAVNCGSDCTHVAPSGSQVTLSAAAGTGFTFTGWSGGGCSGSAITCTVTLSANTTVTATFAPPSFILTVAKSGPGTVTSTSPSNAVNCGSDCTETVPSGTSITLAAAPGAGSTFAGWSGGGCSGTSSCTVTVSGATTLVASFSAPPLVQFSLANYSVSEAGTTATITVTRSSPTASQVQVHYETSDGTALAGTDYRQTWGDLVFLPGQTSKSFTIPVIDTTVVDGPRTVVLRLTDPQNAQLGARETAVLTIQDNDGGGTFKFSATGYTYPDKLGDATITVTRSGGSAGGASVRFRTGAGTAVAPNDYTAISSPQTLLFGAGETSKTFKVHVAGNSVATDSSKTVQLLLSDAGGGATLGSPTAATLTLTNDDKGGGLKFGASSYSVAESASHATVAVTRSGEAASVSVQVVAVSGSAKAGLDYGAPTPSTLSFAEGETSKTIDVPLIANPFAAANRSLTLKLQGPAGGATLSSPSTATLNITKVGIRFSQTAYTVNEGPGSATVTVNRSGSASGVSVQVQTQDDSATVPADYTAISQTLTFSSGQTSKTFTVPIANNPNKSVNRSLQLRLLNAVGEPLGEPDQATLTILDKDKAELQFTAFGPPAVVLAGKTISVPNTVRNVSAKTAPASTVRFMLSVDDDDLEPSDLPLSTRSVGSLGPGSSSSATTTLTIPVGTPTGAHRLFAIVDAGPDEQDTLNNVASAPLTVVSNLMRAFGVSGVLTNEGCTSPMRNGRAVVLGSLAVSSQTGASLSGSLTLNYPLTAGLTTTGPFNGNVDTTGHFSGSFTYTTKQGSTTVSSGTGSLAGTISGPTLETDLTGQSASGETCDLTAWLASPAFPVTFMTFHHDATAGPLDEAGGAFVATPGFPVSLGRYRVLFQVAGDTAPFTPPANVLFTGPAGSQLSNTGGAEMRQLATNAAEYLSPWVSSPPIAPAGGWTEEYEGNYYDYTMANPQAASRLVIPVPTVVQTAGSIARMDWGYRAGNGMPLGGPPAFMRSIRLQLLDPCGLMLHDSLALAPTTLSRTFSPSVTLANVAEVRFQYVDDWDNVFTVRYGGATPGNCKMVEFSAPSYSAAENVSTASITVRRVGDLTGTVTVNFTTSNGTAQQGPDYTNASQLVTLGPSVSSKVVGVPIVNNGTPQGPRTVLLGLGDPGGGATLGPLNTAVLTINDDDPRVQFSSTTYTVSEGSSSATITVQRTGATALVVSVPYSTSNGTALAGFDYTGTAGVLTFTGGQTSKTFTVPILSDTLAEGGQTVNLALGTPIGALLATPDTATLTITDNDAGGTLAFASPVFSVSEGAGSVTITVVRTDGTGGGVTVRYATSNGSGLAGTDYTATSGTLAFGGGETSKTFTVPVRVNAASGANKSVILTLSNTSTGAAVGAPGTATLWIVSQ